MKNNLSNILVAVIAGVVLITVSNASFLADLSGEVVMSVLAGVALLGIAISDYARRTRPLTIRTNLLRPALVHPCPKSTAYSVRRCSAIVERSVA